ncbi:MAG TPA: serine/threonine-protein kinase [Vicinamibacterales bacterium]|nr:serine/threonine-protein kinase [Vicinamibacterales bacterium]
MPWQVGDYATEGEKPFDQGSFGTVWRARRASDGARVALKLVLLTDEADARERIAAERHGAMLQQQFEQAHGMVPRVYEFGQDGDDLFIAMELVEGGALTDLIKDGPIEPRLAAQYAVRICEFLDKAHSFATTVEGEPYDRLVHADLKPGHILIGPSGEIKVLDFGIAKALARTTQVTTNNWGTSAYASPERLDCGHVNEHVDFWSLGVILYEMLSGHRPYPALDRNRSQLEHAIRTNLPREPLPGSVPPQIAAIVSKLLAYQLERRYPSAAAIKSDLERFLAGEQPLALDEYVTPATMPIGRQAARRSATPTVHTVPPTDPLPPLSGAHPNGAPTKLEPAEPPPGPPTPPARVRKGVRRIAWAVLLVGFIGFVAREGVAWVAAERFRGALDELQGTGLVESRNHYDGILAWGVFDAGLRMRVNVPLRERLVSLADGVIDDYRREEPTMGPAEWTQALQSLRWATELGTPDDSLLSKLLTCEAHVIRLGARAQPAAAARQTYTRAMDKFRLAAEVDRRSFDPYLGISRIAVYGLGDVDQAAEAIDAAQERGYASGRRERAMLGDGYMKRANATRLLARKLTGEQRRRELERARADYAGCIDAFDGILGFGYAATNMETCKRYLKLVERDLLDDGSGAEGL